MGAEYFDRTVSAENATGKRRSTEHNVLLYSPAEAIVYTACEDGDGRVGTRQSTMKNELQAVPVYATARPYSQAESRGKPCTRPVPAQCVEVNAEKGIRELDKF